MNQNEQDFSRLMEQMKWEVAREFGFDVPVDGNWGNVPSEAIGKIFSVVRRRVRDIQKQREQDLYH